VDIPAKHVQWDDDAPTGITDPGGLAGGVREELHQLPAPPKEKSRIEKVKDEASESWNDILISGADAARQSVAGTANAGVKAGELTGKGIEAGGTLAGKGIEAAGTHTLNGMKVGLGGLTYAATGGHYGQGAIDDGVGGFQSAASRMISQAEQHYHADEVLQNLLYCNMPKTI
jgi:hypothetical protein